MRETEITVQVLDNFENINTTLLNKGFEVIEEYNNNDWYFIKFDKEQTKLLSYEELISHSIIIRQLIYDTVTNFICYKNKYYDELGNVISEEKTRTIVDSVEKTIEIFMLAKLHNWCNLRNKSYVYKRDEVVFAVQIIEDLGIFIEYEEDQTMKELSEQEKIEKMKDVLNKLSLPLGNDYSCKKIYMKYKQV